MEIAVQFLAVVGPIVLAGMGLYVSLKPPKKKGYSHWRWVGAFVVVGVIAATANFMELHSADEAQEENKATLSKIAKAVSVDPNAPAESMADKIITAINDAVRKAARGSRDPNKLYQENHNIGMVVSGHKDNDQILFETIKPVSQIDFSKQIEFRDFLISCEPSAPIQMSVNGPLREFMYQNVKCRVLGALE